MTVEARVNTQMYLELTPPPRGGYKAMKRVVKNENGKRGLNPNQFRPTDLPRGFQVEPA
jgi:hypothetical protein